MRQDTRECFNNHTEPRPGCAGCHHAFHVLTPGAVVGGELILPRVVGPLECSLCHDVLHARPVAGCHHCDAGFAEVLASAMEASADTRMEIIGLRATHWMIGWHARLFGWIAILSGRAFGDFFTHADGSTQWITLLVSMVAVPTIQWAIGKQIAAKERHLPRLSPRGEIVYGDGSGN